MALAKVEAIATATPRLTGLMRKAPPTWRPISGAATAWEPLAFATWPVDGWVRLGQPNADRPPPFFDLHDEAGLKHEVAASVALGFAAKAAIHPAQIGAINAALTPSAETSWRPRDLSPRMPRASARSTAR